MRKIIPLSIFLTILVFIASYQTIDNINLKNDFKAITATNDSLLINTTEKYLLSLRLNYLYDSIANEYQSSRRAKENCKECLIITTKLN